MLPVARASIHLLLASALAFAGSSTVSAGPVIEPTMEPVVRALAGVPPGAPPGTKRAGATLRQDHVEIAFLVPPDRRVVFRLVHPTAAPPGATVHGPVALATDLPLDHALRRAFVRVLEREGERFRWALAGSRGASGSDPLGDARSSLRMAAHEEVRASVQRALELAGEDVPTLREGAALLRAAGFVDQAAEVVTRARSRLKTELRARTPGLDGEGPSLMALAGEDFRGAAKEVFGRDDAAVCGLVALTDTLSLMGRSREAASWLDSIINRVPSCRDAHHQRCEIYSVDKNWESLLSCARAGARAVPDDVDFGVRQATALRGLGRYEEAIVLLEAAVRARPHASGPMSSLANLYTMTRTHEESWRGLERACNAQPDDIVTCFLAGVLAHYLAKHEACVSRMNALLDALPKQPRVPMYAAISSFYLGRVADADELIARAARISGAMDPDVYYCRSLIQRERNQDLAIGDLERFLRVASQGWHSEGKIERVTQELELLRKGIIPPPAEAHHRAEGAPIPAGARSGGGDAPPSPGGESRAVASTDAAGEQTPPPLCGGVVEEGPGDDEGAPAWSIWLFFALLGLGLAMAMHRRGRA